MAFPYNTLNINSGLGPPCGANVVFRSRPSHIPAGTVQRVDHITGQSSWRFPPEITSHLATIPLPSLPNTPVAKLLIPNNPGNPGNPGNPDNLVKIWACKMCTFNNPTTVTQCSICETSNFEPNQLVWKCIRCTFINNQGTTCGVCSCPKVSIEEDKHELVQHKSTRSSGHFFVDSIAIFGGLLLIYLCLMI